MRTEDERLEDLLADWRALRAPSGLRARIRARIAEAPPGRPERLRPAWALLAAALLLALGLALLRRPGSTPPARTATAPSHRAAPLTPPEPTASALEVASPRPAATRWPASQPAGAPDELAADEPPPLQVEPLAVEPVRAERVAVAGLDLRPLAVPPLDAGP